MKKLVLIITFLLGSSAFAGDFYSFEMEDGCTMKCITRNPFNGKCIAKTKVCDIGSPAEWVEQAGKDVGRYWNDIQREWHTAYGYLPESVRIVLNNSTFTVIGAYFGGLQGALLGQTLDQAILSGSRRIKKAKQVAEEVQLDWQKEIIEQGTLDIELVQIRIVTSGQAAKQALSNQLNVIQTTFLQCVKDAPEIGDGWQCHHDLNESLNDLLLNARRA